MPPPAWPVRCAPAGGSIVQGSAGVRIGAPTGVACSVCPGGVTSGHPVNPLLGAKV
ncbi:hypothetical protein, partial [Escherichia coli]|uniref:hypothetical protein n=1 Tax=Escherichia coli TaxID=562 RepID=UPI003D9BD327